MYSNWRADFSMQEQIIKDILEFGLRYSHATSLAPTGTMSITWGNNCSDGLEPEITDSYFRPIRNPNKKTKTQEEVMSYSYFVWKEKFGNKPLPDYWRTTKDRRLPLLHRRPDRLADQETRYAQGP